MRRLLPQLAFLLTPFAHAQAVSVYGTFSDTHLTNLVTGTTQNGNVYTSSTTSHFTPGFGLGVTFNFLPIGPVRLGLDVRGSSKPGNDGSDLILAGPRLAVKLPGLRLKPYIQASGGYLRTRTTLVIGVENTDQFLAYEITGGLDYPLLPFLDFRVIELGGGQGINAFGSGDGHNTSLFTVNTGLVVHF